MIEYNPENKEGTSSPDGASACVVGIGGAGANVLDRIALENMVDVELVSMNTDIRALTNAVSSRKVQLGAEITRGLGAGGDPELGLEAARSAQQAIGEVLEGRQMVFLCVGLGGGTGSGAAPLVAAIAREAGAFVVVFATMPFSFEGRRRVEQAKNALAELEEASDALIVFENDSMGQLVVSKSGVQEAFAAADQMIGQSVRAVTTLVTQPGLIRIGMDDLMTALRNTDSRCLFGHGCAKGKNRAQEALKRAMKSPLLDGGKMIDRAGSVLVHITGGESMTLYEVELLMNELARRAGDQANVLFGVGVDQQLGESMSVTLISSVSAGAVGVEERESIAAAEEAAPELADEQEDSGGSEPMGEPVEVIDKEAVGVVSGEAGREDEAAIGEAVPTGQADGGPQGQVEMDLLGEAPSRQEAGDRNEARHETPEHRGEAAADTGSAVEHDEHERVAEPGSAGKDSEPGSERRPGGLGINLLPRVFGRAKGKVKEAVKDPDEGQSERAGEAGDAGGEPEEEGGVENERVEKTSVIASFVDRSKRDDDDMPARTAEPEALPVSAQGEQVPGAVADGVDAGHGPAEAGELVDQGALALDEGKAGRFVKGEPTIVDGEDLDVPTFLRRKSSS